MALTLRTAITANDTTFDVLGSDDLEAGDFKTIDSETVVIRSVRSATLGYGESPRYRVSVYRGTGGSRAAAHAANATLATFSGGVSGGSVTVTGTDGTGPFAATGIQAPSVSDAGGGLAVIGPVVISDSDPGAIGPGNLWLNTTQDAFDDLTNFPLLVRNEADAGWIPVMGDAVGPVNLSSYSPDGNNSGLIQLRATNVGLVLNVHGFGPSGQSGVYINDVAPGDAVLVIRASGNVRVTADANGVSFNGADPSIPELPATPDPQDIADALVVLGLVTQAS